MESVIERFAIPVAGGDLATLPNAVPPNLAVDRTSLIRLLEPSPRILVGRARQIDGVLSDADIIAALDDDSTSWDRLPNHSNPSTDIDISVSSTTHNRTTGVLVAIQLRSARNDTFFGPSVTKAIMRNKNENYLFAPRWIQALKTLAFIVAAPNFNADFVLGINLDGVGGSRPIPVLIDPKIENNG